MYYGGITEHPSGAWTTQAARSLFLRHGDHLAKAKALVRDRGSQFVDAFDEIFRTEHTKILKTPIRTPVANAFAERWIGTLRREFLDRTLIWNHRPLERLVNKYIDHYNQHRPHRSLDQRPPPLIRPRAVHTATLAAPCVSGAADRTLGSVASAVRCEIACSRMDWAAQGLSLDRPPGRRTERAFADLFADDTPSAAEGP